MIGGLTAGPKVIQVARVVPRLAPRIRLSWLRHTPAHDRRHIDSESAPWRAQRIIVQYAQSSAFSDTMGHSAPSRRARSMANSTDCIMDRRRDPRRSGMRPVYLYRICGHGRRSKNDGPSRLKAFQDAVPTCFAGSIQTAHPSRINKHGANVRSRHADVEMSISKQLGTSRLNTHGAERCSSKIEPESPYQCVVECEK